ncbi:MAG: hypothetical protein Q9186_000082 [Xanthomendoza sp. 1 TL-2023]
MLQGKSKKPKPSAATASTDDHPTTKSPPPKPSEPFLPIPTEQPTSSAEKTDFEAFYLKQVTAEFADDLDKLRNASDFNDNSLPILIDALKCTARTYSEEEKAEVMYGAK